MKILSLLTFLVKFKQLVSLTSEWKINKMINALKEKILKKLVDNIFPVV